MVSNMKKNKSKKTLILTIIGVILLVVLLIFILNYSKDDATFSLIEKKWITDNENNVIDIGIFLQICKNFRKRMTDLHFLQYKPLEKSIIFNIDRNFSEQFDQQFNLLFFAAPNGNSFTGI